MGDDFRKQAPQPLAPIAFKIPDAYRNRLSNGLSVVLLRDNRVPLVSIRMAFKFGDIHDPEGQAGINSAMIAMLNEGTENYSSRQLAEEIERMGASLGANSGSDSTGMMASALSLYTADIVRLMAEVLLRPTFPEDELELYKKNTIEGLKFQRSQAGFLADEQFARCVYGEHPYSVVSPSQEDVERLSRDAMLAHHANVLKPENATLVAVGDIEPENFIALLESELAEWRGGFAPRNDLPAPPTSGKRRLVVVNRPGSAQSNILLGNLGMRLDDPDYFPALLLNQVLGAGASSRLFMNLREEKGYTYGAYSKFTSRRFSGDFEASAEVRTEVTGASLDEFMKELRKIRDEEVTATELQDAKNYLTGVFPLRAETQEGLANLLVQQELYSLPEDYLRTYRDNVTAVTAGDIRRVAQKYIHPDAFSIVIVGDGAEILRQCSSWADETSCFDTEGRAIDADTLTAEPEAPAVDVSGAWQLTLDFQGQSVPVTLELDQKGSALSGSIDSLFGKGAVTMGKVSGSGFTASAVTEVQGQPLEMTIAGALNDGALSGVITSPAVPSEVPFTGVRK